MKGIKYGAIDYLVKPVRLEELKLIWKHVVKKFLNEKKNINNKKKSKDLVRKRDGYDDIALKDNLASQKRARVSWTPELHAKFINAVNQLGINKAVPIKILDIMDIPGLTRENVASHLQVCSLN
ncbi:Two-component response regulator ARR2 [Dendrobium catenatum]|uniref:Two-component response regulator ARR2 n=1 Tax=Dendrobium catenatum TaxID=906689 RepID=A0A2I0WRZ2_9ASPA|nr:Two-component response regulator ARR2 [Dendrobium catenatum]